MISDGSCDIEYWRETYKKIKKQNYQRQTFEQYGITQ